MPARSKTKPGRATLQATEMSSIFGVDGAMAGALPGYEPREGQLRMAEAVRKALLGKQAALIEAPTGTGKSLAYLLPALLTGQRVVIATANKSLQHQLYAKDLPLAGRILGREIDAALVKGRHNYLCTWKWDKERIERQMLALVDGEDAQVDYLERWIPDTETGDVDELPFILARDLRPRVVSFSDDCLHQACAYYHDDCFINMARDVAANAQVLITNHHLLLTALQLGEQGERILPPAGIYIIDEAHHLVDTATAVFEVEVSDFAVESLLMRTVYKEHVDDDMLEELRFANRLAFDEVVRMRRDGGERGAFRIEEDLPKLKQLAGSLRALAQTMQDFHPYKKSQARIRSEVDADPDWPGAEGGSGEGSRDVPEEGSNAGAGSNEAAGVASNGGPDFPVSRPAGEGALSLDGPGEDQAKARLYDLAVENLNSLSSKILAVASSRADGTIVRFAEPVFGRRNLRMVLRAAPITPASELARCLFEAEGRSVICTSATLAAGDGFEHFKRRCGLERVAAELVAPPVFDYPRQALLYQPNMTTYSWQARDAYYDDAAREIERLLAVSRGRALCLFTSWSGLDQVRRQLIGAAGEAGGSGSGGDGGDGAGSASGWNADSSDASVPGLDGSGSSAAQRNGPGGLGLAEDDASDLLPEGGPPQTIWPIRAQGDAPRDGLLEWFRSTPNAVLLATRSFWEGVDIPGDDLGLVVLDKLPFPSPKDPLHQARMRFVEDAGGHSFGDYTLPLMTLTLKQGFGRLIRRSGDSGVVAILDDRLTNKGYGRRVRGDLPPAGFTRSFGEVHRFYREALDRPADFALDVRAWRVEDEDLEALGESDAEPGIWWWWRLRRLQDGRADGGEGIEPALGDTVAGEFHAAVLGLGNLRKRILAAGRDPADFGVEIRCSREVAGWIENPEELEADALGEGGPVDVGDWLEAREGWRELRVLGVPR